MVSNSRIQIPPNQLETITLPINKLDQILAFLANIKDKSSDPQGNCRYPITYIIKYHKAKNLHVTVIF